MRTIHLSGALLATTALSGVLAIAAPAQSGSFHFHDDHVLGTSLDVTAVGHDELSAALAVGAIRAEITRLDKVLSGWRDDSELHSLNATDAMHASADLFRVISACEDWRRETGGAYSARFGTILNDLRDSACALSPEQARNRAAMISMAPVTLDPASRRIERPGSVVFAIDGLAKGYIIDRAMDAARRVSPCLEGLMIDIGGDLRCWGRSPEPGGWAIGIADHTNLADNAPPASVLRVKDKAVATSGKGYRPQSLVSPATGRLDSRIALATVVADTAADADALATAFAVMTPEDSMALAGRLPGVAAQIIAADGRCYHSSGWSCLVDRRAEPPRLIQIADAGPSAGAQIWPQGYSLDITYEVPRGETTLRRERPYVTLWIANEKGDLVRTLAYFAGKRRFLDENYVFWRRNGAANQAIIESVTRPTRGPGQYNLTWDGLDDRGKPVAQGKYTLFVEAARERGGHSLQRIDLAIGTQDFAAEAAAGGELGKTKAVYGRRA